MTGAIAVTEAPALQWQLAAEKEALPKYAVWKAEGSFGGNWNGAVRIVENGREVWLPVSANETNRDGIRHVLKNLGCDLETGVEIDMPIEQQRRTRLALEVMPPLLAFNFGASTGFSEELLKNYHTGEVTPIIAPDAPPQSGKTLGIIAQWLTNSELISVWDFDPFSGQSVSACLNSVQEKLERQGIDPKKSLSKLVRVITEVYLENKAKKASEPRDFNMATLLDTAMTDYLANVAGKGKLAVIADVSGYTDKTKRWSPFRLLCHLLPSVNLASNDEGGGIPSRFLPPGGPSEDGYYYVIYDRISANLGRSPMREGNEDQQFKALRQARHEQQKWKDILGPLSDQ